MVSPEFLNPDRWPPCVQFDRFKSAEGTNHSKDLFLPVRSLTIFFIVKPTRLESAL